MRKRNSWRIALSLLLIGLFLAGLLPVEGIAQSDSEKEVIVSFDMPVTELTVSLGIESADIPLPKTLTATFEGGGTADIPVTWETDGYNRDAEGTYLFSADIGTWVYAKARPVTVVTVVPPDIDISGKLWLDENGDSIREAGETGIAGYPVTLYAEDDLNTVVQTTLTKADGAYRFEGMEPGSYVVRVTSETIDGTEYLLPLAIENDNNFEMDEEAAASWSVPLEVVENSMISGIDAGMRLQVGIRPFSEVGVFSFDDIEMLLLFNQVHSGDTILIYNDIEFTDSIVFEKSLNLTFKAAEGIGPVTLTSKNQRHFIISENKNVELTFENVILDGGGTGGGISVNEEGSLVLTSAEITNCYDSMGAGVYAGNRALSVALFDCEIYRNVAEQMGGGVYTWATPITIANCDIYENSAMNSALGGGGGGVCFNQDAGDTGIALNIWNSRIYSNSTPGMGGGVLAVDTENGIISGCEIYGNTGQFGGGILLYGVNGAVTTVSDSKIANNEAMREGGGIYFMGVTSTETIAIKGSSEIFGNISTDDNGGGIYALNGIVNINGGGISNNSAAKDGGGIYTNDLTKLFVSDVVTFSDNSASKSAIPLPNMADEHPQIETTSSSIYDHPLNNYDINVLTVKVYFIDGNGDPIDGLTPVGYAAVSGYPFTFPAESAPFVSSYVFTDWKESENGVRKGNTTVLLPNVTADTDIYLIYEKSIVTVSKEVNGIYADRTKDFLFTIYFSNSGGAPLAEGTVFLYTGGTKSSLEAEADAPADGMLTLDEEGKATFTLKHGQQISIVAVPQSTVRVVESADTDYMPSFLTGAALSATNGPDTGTISLDGTDRRFDFINTRIEVVPAGALIRNIQVPALLGLSMLLLMEIAGAGMIRFRRKRGL